jgi:hypothetical protein
MKRFIASFLATLFACAVVGLVASALMSDGIDTPDGVDRLGFPFVFKAQSGSVAMDYFSRGRLIADVAISAALSTCVGLYVVRNPPRRECTASRGRIIFGVCLPFLIVPLGLGLLMAAYVVLSWLAGKQ